VGTSQNEQKEEHCSDERRVVGVQQDGEESDFVAVRELRLVGSILLEHQVAATIGGGIGADRPEAGSVVHSKLEGRERLSDGLRGCICGLWRWSVPRPGAVESNSARFRRGSKGQWPYSTHHSTPLIGTRLRIRVSLERGGVS
jgi:hypothetical protein